MKQDTPHGPDLSDEGIGLYTAKASITANPADLAAIREEFVKTYGGGI